MGLTSNPYAPWLARLRRPDRKAPKRLADYQFYMQHADFKAKVEQKFAEECWNVPRADHLAQRCEIARGLFALESREVKDRIRKEAMEELEDEMAKWKDADEGLPSVEPEDQEQ
jgi:hypothetical protein